ncbi:hypothetical protein SAMN05444359_1552 [Neolewinella agarilytica]|uniref:Uncharacterized protein n=1 Tax=Neolewinella agarilytica TaxID=478744 RepID=A0A1H9PIU2_9BACT|nr:hypothetical protein SAMN05444359_1552 [Neolewinella agarilytica]
MTTQRCRVTQTYRTDQTDHPQTRTVSLYIGFAVRPEKVSYSPNRAGNG